MKGIDISCYNAVSDYEATANSIDFAILKIIRKDGNKDKLFETHYEGLTKYGVPIQGVYNYSYATTKEKAVTDAKKVLEALNGRPLMVWLDIEDSCLTGLGAALPDIIRAYAGVIKSAGYPFGVYTGLYFYNKYLKQYASLLPYPWWIARYPSSLRKSITVDPNTKYMPTGASPLYGWQYSSKGIVPGISGNVDLNVWYEEVETGETPTVPTYTIRKGNKGENVVQLQKCLNVFGANIDEDGSFGPKTYKAVKNWQKANGLSADGIYGPKSFRKMSALLG